MAYPPITLVITMVIVFSNPYRTVYELFPKKLLKTTSKKKNNDKHY